MQSLLHVAFGLVLLKTCKVEGQLEILKILLMKSQKKKKKNVINTL